VFFALFTRKLYKPLTRVVPVDCLVFIEGAISKISGRDWGIYVFKEYQGKIKDLQGRRVKVLVVVDDCKEA
jgi:hypothetical protein